MADIRTRMAMILDNQKMPADAKLSLLKTIQTHFDKLQKDIGLPSTGSFTTGTSEPAVIKVKNDTAVNNTSAPNNNEGTTDQEEFGESDADRQSEKRKSCPMINPPPCLFNSWEFTNNNNPKRASFFSKLPNTQTF